MNLRLVISVFVFFVLVGITETNAQNEELETEQSSSTLMKLIRNKNHQRMGSFSLSYQSPQATGSNFIGNGLKGDDGYSLRLQFFVYGQFFLGVNLGQSNFDVINQDIVGNYNGTKLNESFVYIGYQLVPLNKFRINMYSSIFGNANFENSITNAENNRDTGHLYSFGFGAEYEVIRNLNIFFDYSFRTSKTDIEVPQQLQSVFEKGTYNTINFGLKFSFGDRDIYSLLAE